MYFTNRLPSILLLCFLVLSCSVVSEDEENGNKESTEGTESLTHSLTIDADPAEGGEISPSSGDYDGGTQIELTATVADGYEFEEWTGDINSSDNPLVFTINADTDITAHFRKVAKEFNNTITVTDSENSFDLDFGMDANATAGFDEDLDQEAPPSPPEGAFYTHFTIDNGRLIKDLRPISKSVTEWKLEFIPEEGRSISLKWDFNQSQHVGTLILTDDPSNPAIEIDMKNESSYDITDTSINTLYIVSSNADDQ